ncbi:MAG TPA: SHOCT domain-containing protein [Dehalococcoidia bacterium]|nr:SHOCT domain-containing protein [Dehalococcoidia bacterium]
MMWEMHDGWGWWMVFGWVWMALLIALVVWAVVAVTSREGSAQGRGEGDALEILRRRYARGEIDEEEFEQRRQRLSTG